MALRVWLPLNGNIKNQGLGPQPVNDGTLTYDNGKIGQCRKTGGAKFTASQSVQIFNDNGFTYCAWIYVPGEAGGAIGSPNCFFGRDGAPRIYAIFQYPKVDDLHLSWTQYNDDKSSAIYKAGIQLNDFFDVKTWVHVAVTYEPGKIIVYKNGVQYATATGTPTWSTQPGGYEYETWALTNTPNAYFNDIRVYDECLSPKQIKEISKGLIAHYKLDGPKANENLILRSDKIIGSSQASGITCTSMSDNSYKIVAASGNGNWCRLSFAEDSNTNVGNKLSVGDTYTISCDIKVEEGTIFPTLFINNGNGYKQLGGPSLKLNTWQRVYYTNTWNEPGTSYGNIALHLGFSSAIGTYYFKNFKLEKGSFTPWIPAPTDPMYTSLGYVNDIGTDCSGNGYFLTDIDSSSTISTDSARYSTCVQRTSPTKGIGKIPTIFSLNQQINEITLCGWWKTTVSDTNTKNLIALGQNSFIRFGGSSNTNVWTYVKMGGTTQALTATGPSLIDDKWHFLATTFKNGVITTYVDGQQTGTVDKSSVATTLSCDAVGGCIGSYNGTVENVGGSISDCRIYATALSANEILTMYKNSGIIDNKGNVYAYEFKEE